MGFFNKPNHPNVKYQEDSYMFVMAGCSRNDFFCITFSFPLWHYQLRYAKKEKKILITLNAFEDEQSNYKAVCGQMWPTGGPGP